MGVHSGGTRRIGFLGSTTRRITLLSKRPVLIVPVADADHNEWPEALI
jgi:nucleotide-binding universal stress UspA family protein